MVSGPGRSTPDPASRTGPQDRFGRTLIPRMAMSESTRPGGVWTSFELREMLIGQLAGLLKTHRTLVDPNKSF